MYLQKYNLVTAHYINTKYIIVCIYLSGKQLECICTVLFDNIYFLPIPIINAFSPLRALGQL